MPNAIQPAARRATPSGSGVVPAPLVLWRPAQRVDFASQRLLTMHTHDACKTDGREGQSIEAEANNFIKKLDLLEPIGSISE